MKLLHLADLHLGKRVNGFSMLEDQAYIINEIMKIIGKEEIDVVLIAGDLYDRSIPSEEAVNLFDTFLVQLSKKNLQVILISGNHDSAERISFGGSLMKESGIHIAPVFYGKIDPVILYDNWGPVYFWPIPFLKPAQVRKYFEEKEISSYTDAMSAVISTISMEESKRNVALAHQFLLGGSCSDSEEVISVGGTEEIDASLFLPFDYTALGHLHRPQKVLTESIRYAGSPLKYSISECHTDKSVTVIDMQEKNKMVLKVIPLKPLRDFIQIKGHFADIIGREEPLRDYCEIVLYDEEDIPNALDRLRGKYPYLMSLQYDNTRTRHQSQILYREESNLKSPLELFDDLYSMQNGQAMSKQQREYLTKMIQEIWEETL